MAHDRVRRWCWRIFPIGLLLALAASVSATTEDYLTVGGAFSTAGSGAGQGTAMAATYDGTRWTSLHNNENTGSINAFAYYNNQLYVGGSFTQMHSKLLGLVISLSNIAVWNSTLTFFQHIGTGGDASGPVYSFLEHNGLLYVGGGFGSLDGVSASAVAVWNGTDASPLGSGLSGTVYALAAYNDVIIAAGDISSVNHIAYWDPTQATWTELGGGAQYFIYALAVFKGLLYVGGDFTRTGTVANYRLAAWNGTSQSWLAMPQLTVVSSSPGVRTFFVDGDTLYMGGGFTGIGGSPVNRLATTTDGVTWTAFGKTWDGVTGIPDCLIGSCNYATVYTIAKYDSEIYVGGNFQFQAANSRANYWARYNATLGSWVLPPGGYLDGIVYSSAVVPLPVLPCDSVASCLYTNPNTTALAAMLLDETYDLYWLYATLNENQGSFFAPSNAALAGYTAAGLGALIYHVLASNIAMPASFSLLNTGATAAFGQPQVVGVNVTAQGQIVAFFGDITNPNNTAHVLAANLKCHNGYINIVDKVFVIPPDVQTVLAEQGTSDFIEALTLAGIWANLSTAILPSATIFAPTNAAFETTFPAWRSLPVARLQEMLWSHIVPGLPIAYTTTMANTARLNTHYGSQLVESYIPNTGPWTMVDSWTGTVIDIVGSNIFANNGVVHTVNGLLARSSAVVYTGVVIPSDPMSVTKLDSDPSVSTKNCAALRSGAVLGGWTATVNGSSICCVTRGVLTDGTILTRCDSSTVISSDIYAATGASLGYTNCYGSNAWTKLDNVLKSSKPSRSQLDASSSFGNNATTVKRSAMVMSAGLIDGAYVFVVGSGSRRTSTTNVYCTGTGVIAIESGVKSCVLNACGQETPHFVAVDLATATAGTKCFHTCFTS